MRKLSFLILSILISGSIFAQEIKDKVKTEVNGHPNDHFMLQLSSDHWMGAPDSISSHIKGSSRGANVYLMINKPFQSNKHLSAAFGVGVGTSHVFMSKMNAGITGNVPVLRFTPLDTVNHYSKYKVATAFLEIPVELRYFSKPENPNKSIKVALGVKVGTLVNAHTKGKTLVNKSGTKVLDYTEKLSSKSYFNTTRLAATARIGYANFSLFGTYSLTPIFKDKVAANMSLLQVGLNLSGL
jgi:hypothetical protein